MLVFRGGKEGDGLWVGKILLLHRDCVRASNEVKNMRFVVYGGVMSDRYGSQGTWVRLSRVEGCR